MGKDAATHIEELVRFGLVPDGVPYEVTPPELAGVDLSMQQKLSRMVTEMGLTAGGSMIIQVRQLFAIVGIDAVDQPGNLQEQVDMLPGGLAFAH